MRKFNDKYKLFNLIKIEKYVVYFVDFIKRLFGCTTMLIKKITNPLFTAVRFILNIALKVRFGVYSPIEKRYFFLFADFIASTFWVIWVIIRAVFSPVSRLFKFLGSERGRKVLAYITWWPIIMYLGFTIIWLIYILSCYEHVRITFNVIRVPIWSDISTSFIAVRVLFLLAGFLLVLTLFFIRVLKGSVPISAGLALLKAFSISLLFLVVSQLHGIVFYIKTHFMSFSIGSTVLDLGWVNVSRTVSDDFISKCVAHYADSQGSSLSAQQITDIIESSGGSVDAARAKTASLLGLASQVFANVASLPVTLIQNASVVTGFVSTNPKFVAMLSAMALFGGLRLYYKGLVGLCPLHTFGDSVDLIGQLATSLRDGVLKEKKKENPDDFIPGYWFGNPYDPWILPVSWYSGPWYAYCVAGWYSIEADVYYSTFGHSLLTALNTERGKVASDFYDRVLFQHSDWYPPLHSIINLPITLYHAISSSVNGSTVVGSVFLTNIILRGVRESFIQIEQQRISNFVDNSISDRQTATTVEVSSSQPLLPIVEDNNKDSKLTIIHNVTEQTESAGENWSDGWSDEEDLLVPLSPKPWDSPSRGWPRTRLGFSEEEFQRMLESNDPESVGSSDGRTAASIAREAAGEVDKYGWQTALDYQPLEERTTLEDFPECPPHEKGKEKLYTEDNRPKISFLHRSYVTTVLMLSSVWHAISLLFRNEAATSPDNSNENTPSSNTIKAPPVTGDGVYGGVINPEPLEIPESILESLHPLHAADMEAYANSAARDQIQIVPGVGIISPKSPYLNKNIPISPNFAYLMFDIFGPISRFMLAPVLGVSGMDWTFYLSMFSVGTSLINRVVKVLDVFSGTEYLTPLISRGFITPEERAAVALYELQLDRKLKPTTAGYFFPFPRGANFIMRLWGEDKFLVLYRDYINLCIHHLTNTQLLELKAAFTDDGAWNELINKSPQELGEFMLKHKSMGSYLIQARNSSHLEVKVLSAQAGSNDVFERVDPEFYKPPTDLQIRSYLRSECVLIDAELERRRLGSPLDEWDNIHYAHILLRQGQFPVLPQSWLGPEHFNLTASGKTVEVVREPPYFKPNEIQPFDSVNRHARVAQLIRVIEAGKGDAVCFRTPHDFKFVQLSAERLNPSSVVVPTKTFDPPGESSIV